MDRNFVKAFKRLFAEYGVTNFHFETGSNHPRVIASYQGRSLRATFPSSASDFRGLRNALAHVRRELGLRPAPRAPRAPRSSTVPHHCVVRQPRSPIMTSPGKLAELPSAATWKDVLAHWGSSNGQAGA